jgi:hypothetical protein
MLHDNTGGLLVATDAVVIVVSVVWTAEFPVAVLLPFRRSSCRWGLGLNKRLKKLRIAFIGPPLPPFVVAGAACSVVVTGSEP